MSGTQRHQRSLSSIIQYKVDSEEISLCLVLESVYSFSSFDQIGDGAEFALYRLTPPSLASNGSP